jgi:hypothetical protein
MGHFEIHILKVKSVDKFVFAATAGFAQGSRSLTIILCCHTKLTLHSCIMISVIDNYIWTTWLDVFCNFFICTLKFSNLLCACYSTKFRSLYKKMTMKRQAVRRLISKISTVTSEENKNRWKLIVANIVIRKSCQSCATPQIHRLAQVNGLRTPNSDYCYLYNWFNLFLFFW